MLTKRLRTLSVIAIVLSLIFALYIYFLTSHQREFYRFTVEHQTESLSRLVETIPSQTYSHYRSRIKSFATTKKRIAKAVAEQDRQALLKMAAPFQKILKNENPFFITMGFVTPDMKVLLRVSMPQLHGDRPVSKMVNEANLKQQALDGFEILQTGLAYRLVHPLFYQGKYVGLLTFVLDGHQFFNLLRDHFITDVGLFFPTDKKVPKTLKIREGLWESHLERQVGSYLIQTPSAILARLAQDTDLDKASQQLSIDGRQVILLTGFGLADHNKQRLCRLVVSADITELHNAFASNLQNSTILCVFLSVIALLVVYLGFGSLSEQIISLNKALQEKVAKRTSELAREAEKRQHVQELWEKTANALDDIIAIQDGMGQLVQTNRAGQRLPEPQLQALLAELAARRQGQDAEQQGGEPQLWQQEFFHQESGKELQVQTIPLFNEDGGPFGQVHVVKDVTLQKQARSQLQKAKDMDLLGQMAGGVAHDLNNILSGVINYPELLLMDMAVTDPNRQLVESIQASGLRAAAVVADMLTLTRGAIADKQLHDFNQLIRQLCKAQEYSELLAANPAIDLVPDLQAEQARVFCSLAHIQKILLNLVANGIEAQQGQGTITILTRNESVASAGQPGQPQQSGRYLVLEVADQGPGISLQDQRHIFDPFYTKKEMGRQSGTGLGLTVVWYAVHDHQGEIFVESSSTGTLFRIYLPVAQQQQGLVGAETDQPGEVDALPLGKGESVLVVDDEQSLCDIACRLLASLNYQAACVATGEEALPYLAENKVDLVILDMLLGSGMNGRETYEAIIKEHPGQRAIIASGFSEDDEVKLAMSKGVSAFMMKPYSRSRLATVVQKGLYGEGGREAQ